MSTKTPRLILLCALACLAALPLLAQEWGQRDRGVTLHRDLDFTGFSQTFSSDVPDLRRTRIGM